MKMLTVFSMILASSISFASIEKVLPKEEAINVMTAVQYSLDSHDLPCVTRKGDTSIKFASKFNWTAVIEAMGGTLASKYVVETEDDLSQPVITITINLYANEKEVVQFTTNAEMTVVTKLDYKYMNTVTTSTRVNTGTILNPKFETRTEVKETITKDVVCE